MTHTPGSGRANRPGMPAHALRHPLAAAAKREGLDRRHLAVTAGRPPLPLLLLRAEPAEEATHRLVLRIGVLVDAGAVPGRGQALRGVLTLQIDPETRTMLQAGAGSLERRIGPRGSWRRVPLAPPDAAGSRYRGRTAAMAAALQAWAASPAAGPAVAAALAAGAASLERAAAVLDAEAALHEQEAGRGAATEPHRRRALAWAARQRGFAAQQRRQAQLMQGLAATQPTAGEPAQARRQLEAWAAARARLMRRGDKAVHRRPTRRAAAIAPRRLGDAAPQLAAALEALLAAFDAPDPPAALPSALAGARERLSALRDADRPVAARRHEDGVRVG